MPSDRGSGLVPVLELIFPCSISRSSDILTKEAPKTTHGFFSQARTTHVRIRLDGTDGYRHHRRALVWPQAAGHGEISWQERRRVQERHARPGERLRRHVEPGVRPAH